MSELDSTYNRLIKACNGKQTGWTLTLLLSFCIICIETDKTTSTNRKRHFHHVSPMTVRSDFCTEFDLLIK